MFLFTMNEYIGGIIGQWTDEKASEPDDNPISNVYLSK